MNFWKTFVITLVVYLALNTVFVLIAMFTVPYFPATDVIFIVASIFSPIAMSPQLAWIDNGIVPLLSTTDLVTDLMLFLKATCKSWRHNKPKKTWIGIKALRMLFGKISTDLWRHHAIMSSFWQAIIYTGWIIGR